VLASICQHARGGGKPPCTVLAAEQAKKSAFVTFVTFVKKKNSWALPCHANTNIKMVLPNWQKINTRKLKGRDEDSKKKKMRWGRSKGRGKGRRKDSRAKLEQGKEESRKEGVLEKKKVRNEEGKEEIQKGRIKEREREKENEERRKKEWGKREAKGLRSQIKKEVKIKIKKEVQEHKRRRRREAEVSKTGRRTQGDCVLVERTHIKRKRRHGDRTVAWRAATVSIDSADMIRE
jgi:hypothetical protein